MKKLHVRKLSLTRETLRRLDLTKAAGALAAQQPIKGINPIGNTVQGTSCGLCSDYVYCGPSANPCETETVSVIEA